MSTLQSLRLAVRDFMTRGILSVQPSSNVTRAARLMADRNIGSVVVAGKEGPLGLFTERDLLTKVFAGQLNPESTPVSKVLSPFVSVESGATARQAAEAMLKGKGRLLVFEGSERVGIVTATDLLKAIYRIGIPLDISKLISKPVLTIWAVLTVKEAAMELATKRVGSLVVKEKGVPSEIFTERDFLSKVYVPKIAESTAVGTVASSPLISAEVGVDGKEAAGLMLTRGIKRLPLFGHGTLEGMITARDLAEAFASANIELIKQMRVSYGDLCPICNTRIDETGLCACGAGSE